jgi:LysM repeat protein
MLKRGIEVLVGAALMVALLAVLPGVAQAQEGRAAIQEAPVANRGADATSARVVIRPGDTLWSISSEQLGPNATSQQIAAEAERIYALNRDLIGPDPNLIFSGQELSLPTTGGSSAAESATKKTAPEAQQSAKPAQETAAQGGRTAKAEQADQQTNLPKAPASKAVPAVGSLASETPPTTSPLASFPDTVRSAVSSAVAASVRTLAEAQATAEGRRLLGSGIIALTLLVGALMAWKLPMKRSIGDEMEVWGIYPGYQGRYVYSEPLNLRSSAPQPETLNAWLEPAAKPSINGSKAEATGSAAPTKSVSHVDRGSIAQKRNQLTRRRSRPRPRRKSAAEAYKADARRLLRGAGVGTRARQPREGRIKTSRRVARGGR